MSSYVSKNCVEGYAMYGVETNQMSLWWNAKYSQRTQWQKVQTLLCLPFRIFLNEDV